MRKYEKKKGFTLIELIVVIAILGILAAIAVPRLTGVRANAAKNADIATARVIAGAAATYEADTGNVPSSIGDLVPKYLDEIPIAKHGTGEFVLTNDETGYHVTDSATPTAVEYYPTHP